MMLKERAPKPWAKESKTSFNMSVRARGRMYLKN